MNKFWLASAALAGFVSGLTATAQGAAAQSATATDDTTAAVEEIVVTAQKETRSLRETPASVAVVSGETLARANVSTLDDLGRSVPSLTTLPAANQLRPNYTMRGIGTDVLTIGAPSGVAVLIDGVTLAPESLGARQLADAENVEILRGPQSTLGGRTASVGVINIVTRKPTQTWQGRINGVVTNDDEYRASVSVSGPLNDALAFSLSGFAGSTELLTHSLTTGRNDTSRGQGIRGKLLFQPTAELDITLSGSYLNMRDRGSAQAYISVAPNALFRGFVSPADALPRITPVRGNTDYATLTEPGQNGEDQLYSLTVDYRLGDFTLSSITARQVEDRTTRYDLYTEAVDWISRQTNGASPYNNIQTSILAIRGLSQEFKLVSPELGPVRFIAGLYYDHSATGFDFDRPSTGFAPLLFTAFRKADSKTYAAYARAEWKLRDTTTLITGLRYNYDKIAYIYNLQRFAPAAFPVPFTRTDTSNKSTPVGDVTLKQEIAERANVYATYSRGYKPQIWNLDGSVTPTNTFNPVGRENVDNYEIGLKGDFLDRMLTLNVAGFYTVYRNFQVQSLAFGLATTFDVRNAGKASTRGIEIEGTLRPFQGSSINFGAARVDAKYDSFPGALCFAAQTVAEGCTTVNGASSQDLTGKTLPRAPKWKFNLGASQLIALSGNFNLDLGAAFTYQSPVNFDASGSPRTIQSGYGLVNLSAGLAQTDGRYSVSLFVNNVADKDFNSQLLDLSARWGNRPAVIGIYSREAHRYGGIRAEMKF